MLTLRKATVEQRTLQSGKNIALHARVSNRRESTACELMNPLSKRITANHMPSLNTGFSNIFSTRIGERNMIQGDPENHHRIEMQPDRIHGLRTTDAIKKILKQPHVSHLGETSELEDGLLGRLTISCNPDSGGLAIFRTLRTKRRYRYEIFCTYSSNSKKTDSTEWRYQEAH
jgi:hypothetical protein